MTTTDAILPLVLPVGLSILLGLVGLFRGVRREAVLAASIVLGALIVEQWAAPWSGDMYDVFTGVSREWQQTLLSYALMILIMLVLGYGLGRFLVAGPLSGGVRLGGLLLGVANGAALGGWLLRYIYQNLDGAQANSPLYRNEASRDFMIWAGWFPVALAVLGAIVALVSPLRRAQTVVAQPAPATDWAPIPPAVSQAATPQAPVYVPVTSTIVAAPATPRVDPLAPTMPHAYPYDRPIAPAPPSYNPPEITPEHDAPSTRLFSVNDVAPPTREMSGADLPGASTRSFTPSPSDSSVTIAPSSAVHSPQPEPFKPAWSPEPTPSWLMESADSNPGVSHEATEGARVEGEQNAQNVLETIAPVAAAEQLAEGSPNRKCANCGAPLLSNAQFCTECGTRATSDE